MPTSILKTEIDQQPEVIRNLLNSQQENVQRIARQIRGKFQYVLIAARGTSDNAARYAQYLLGINNRLQVALATPSVFSIYHAPVDLCGALVIGISQSGQSPDIVSVIAEAKKQGRPTLAITNNPQSPLAENAEYLIPLQAGEERAVAATKTYTASLAALALLSCSLLEHPEYAAELQKLPDAMQTTLQNTEIAIARAERYRYMEHCAVIGRGYNYASAFEIALKIKELTRVVAEPYSSADFRHGPIATAQSGFPVILIAPRSAVQDDLLDLIRNLQSRGAELLIISDDPAALEQAHFPLPIARGLPEWLTPLITVLPGQRFAMQLAIEKHLNVDQPEGLTKVTETL
ncbi:MAG: SIS domain-containing protein [Anaerolineae bacterium]|nr:SIS domain-containing protein [Anaerolineae bacterium]